MTEIQELVARLRNYDQCHDGDIDKAADVIEQLASKQQRQIKPLVWERGNELIDEWTAETPFGKFRVFRRPQDEVARIYLSAIKNIKHPHIESVEETKAYCEAEYERCVMECLE